MKRVLKIFLIFLSVVLGILILALMLVGPIARRQIEKNSVEWMGRRISVGDISINPFTGGLTVNDIKVYEPQGDSIFFSCKEIHVELNLKKLLHKYYEAGKIEIDGPEIHIFQNGDKFSFDDLIKRFSTNKPKQKDTDQLHYDISNISIKNGSIVYNNVLIHNRYELSNLNLDVPEICWNKPESKLNLAFNSNKGVFYVNMDANLKTLTYNLNAEIKGYDLSQYYAPLNTYLKISSLKGTLDAKLRMHSRFDSAENFSLMCRLQIKDLEVNDMAKRKLFAIGELVTNIDSLNIKHNLFDFSKIELDRPYVAYDELPKGSNFSMILVHHEAKSEKIERDTVTGKVKRDYSNVVALIESSLKGSTINLLAANYQVDNFYVRNGEFMYNDLTPHHTFHASVSSVNVATDEIESRNRKVYFKASAVLDDTGRLVLKAKIGYDFNKKIFSYGIDTFVVPDLSPVAKYVLEKNSVKWTGRNITTGNIKVDPMNGSIDVKNIKVYEADSINVFFACHNIYVKVNLKSLTDNVYQVDKIQIDDPQINVMQNGDHFNFDDIIKHFSSSDTTHQTTDTAKGPGLHYVVKNVAVSNAAITYNNVPIHNVFKLHELNLSIPELRWDNPQISVHLDFNYGIGGFVNADMDVDRNKLKYSLALDVSNYDISQYYAPLNSFLAISSLQGQLNTKLRLHGTFNKPDHISGTGYIHINNLEIKDTAGSKVFGLGELALNIDTVNVHHGIFSLHNILLDKPFMRLDYYTNGNNISKMIKYTSAAAPVKDTSTGGVKPDYSNIFTLLASSVKMMSVNFLGSNYHTDSITIRNGTFLYNDYTLNVPFHYSVSSLNIFTGKISAAKKNITFNAFAKLNDTGKLVMSVQMSLDLKNMLLNYDVTDLRIADFNPYSEYYVGTPFLDGYMKYHSTDSVINRNLKSSNSIHIEGIRVGDKEGKPVYDLPVKMAVTLLKDGKDNIDLNIPAKGNLDDPNYKIGPLVGRISKELVVKTASSPFKALGKLFNRKPEEMKYISFDYMEEKLPDKEADKLELIYKVLEKKKELAVDIVQIIDSVEEKLELAVELAKKQYYEETNHIVNDSLLGHRKRKKALKAEDKIATQDSLFDAYLDKKLDLTSSQIMTTEDKCVKLIGESKLEALVHRNMMERNQEITDFLIKKKKLPLNRVKVEICKDSNLVRTTPEPEYHINYHLAGKE